MAHGVDRGDVVRANVAVINGCFRLSLPVGIVLVWMGTDFCQQLEFRRLRLMVTPASTTKTINNVKDKLVTITATATKCLLHRKYSSDILQVLQEDVVFHSFLWKLVPNQAKIQAIHQKPGCFCNPEHPAPVCP